jgi:pilus assembly protein CpaC
MHPTNRGRRLQVGVLVLMGLAIGGTALTGQEPTLPPRPVEGEPMRTATGAVIVPIGVSQNLPMASRKPIASVQLDKDGIVRAAPNAVDRSMIVLTGISAGTVRITLTDSDGKKETYDIIVQLDVTYVKKILADAVPTANIDIKPVLNRTIILTGWVAKAEDVDTIMKVANAVLGQGASVINAMQVGGVRQVQLDVTIAQVNRSEFRRRGFNFAFAAGGFGFASVLGGLVDGGAGGSGGTGTGVGGLTAVLPIGSNIVFGTGNFKGLLEILREEALAKLLAEPKLITLSGRPAHFMSGGQKAVLSASSGITGPGVEFKDIGTEVDFLPIVLGNGRIYLEVHPRVRTVNPVNGLIFQGTQVDGFDEQSVRTALELEPGQTMAIGGLIQTQTTSSTNKVPVLGDLPYVGAAFSRVIYKDQETELVILVTPFLVDGQDCRQAPKRLPGRETRKPDDYELFLEGLMEAPRGKREVFENQKYKAAYKNDPSYNQFPCADPLPPQPRGSRRGGGNCGPNGNCQPAGGAYQPAGTTFAPSGLPREVQGRTTDVIPPGASSSLLPGAALPGPTIGSSNGRTTVESLPQPRSGRQRAPMIPQPQLDDEPK